MTACEDYGPLISAMIDGELPPDESAALEEHLLSCCECNRRSKVFREFGRLASNASPIPSSDWRESIQHRVRVHRRRQRVSWTTTYVAAAAVLVAMVGAVIHFGGADSAPATGIAGTGTADSHVATSSNERDMTGPLETLQIVSRQEKRTHDSMRKLMEWDLRALKIEVKQMNLSPDQVERLNHRIDALIRRIDRPGNNVDNTEIGESI
jgi:hypothetical protein